MAAGGRWGEWGGEGDRQGGAEGVHDCDMHVLQRKREELSRHEKPLAEINVAPAAPPDANGVINFAGPSHPPRDGGGVKVSPPGTAPCPRPIWRHVLAAGGQGGTATSD